MTLELRQITLPAERNVPVRDGVPLSAWEHRADVGAGFAHLYRLLVEHRDELLADQGPLAALSRLRTRVLLRPTRIYGALLVTSWVADVLRSEEAYAEHLAGLAQAYGQDERATSADRVLAAEIDALAQLDVPVFSADAGDTALILEDGTRIPDALVAAGAAQMRDVILGLDEADLALQAALVDGALAASGARTPEERPAADEVATPVGSRPLATGALVAEAVRLGEELERRAVPDGDGVMWIGLEFLEPADRYQLEVAGTDLYDGTPGIALFLAALAAVTGERRFGALAVRAVDATLQRLAGSGVAEAGHRGIGAALGTGSVVYALTRVAQLLGDAALLRPAAELAATLTPAVIAGDERLDVMSGAAGALLALLALHGATGRPEHRAAAIACGDRLVGQLAGDDGRRAWPTLAGQRLSGFSHGAAGIAHALVRLHAATGAPAYLDAAEEGVAFERASFSREAGAWPDLRGGPTRDGAHPVKWCHGATGIGLGRLAMRRTVRSRALDEEIATALRLTLDAGPAATDYLCCGTFGRIEALLVAAQVTGGAEHRRAALDLATGCVARARAIGRYTLFVDVPELFNPGFFQGVAGIGFELLRLADDDLPSALLFD
jgi:type 2 lantibiotic biosynthesis protein LanM